MRDAGFEVRDSRFNIQDLKLKIQGSGAGCGMQRGIQNSQFKV